MRICAGPDRLLILTYLRTYVLTYLLVLNSHCAPGARPGESPAIQSALIFSWGVLDEASS